MLQTGLRCRKAALLSVCGFTDRQTTMGNITAKLGWNLTMHRLLFVHSKRKQQSEVLQMVGSIPIFGRAFVFQAVYATTHVFSLVGGDFGLLPRFWVRRLRSEESRLEPTRRHIGMAHSEGEYRC
jgi:hypothetical protein